MILDHLDFSEIRGPVYILPFSCVGIVINHLMNRNHIEVAGFADNNPNYAGKSYQDIPILSPEQACEKRADATYIIATLEFRKELAEQLNDLGANTILYAGQFLDECCFCEALDDMDEGAALNLVEWSHPKTMAKQFAPYFWQAEPRLDRNLKVRNLSLPLNRASKYYDWIESIEKLYREADFMNTLIFHLPPFFGLDISRLEDAIKALRYVIQSDNPPKLIKFFSRYNGPDNKTMVLLSRKLTEAGIPFCIDEGHQTGFAETHTNKPPVLLLPEKAYSHIEEHYQCIYTHITKNAGSSLNRFLLYAGATEHPHHSHHKYASDVKAFDQERFERYFKFVIARNPWDRFVSLYFYEKKQAAKYYRSYPKIWNTPTFRESVLHLRDLEMPPDPQYLWVCDENGNILVDYIGRFENLAESFEYIGQKLGIPPDRPIPHANATQHKPYTEYYDEEMIEIVRNAYKKDIELFGYEFDKHPGPNIIVNPREDFVPANIARNADFV